MTAGEQSCIMLESLNYYSKLVYGFQSISTVITNMLLAKSHFDQILDYLSKCLTKSFNKLTTCSSFKN